MVHDNKPIKVSPATNNKHQTTTRKQQTTHAKQRQTKNIKQTSNKYQTTQQPKQTTNYNGQRVTATPIAANKPTTNKQLNKSKIKQINNSCLDPKAPGAGFQLQRLAYQHNIAD